MADEAIATFKINEEGRNGELRIFPDRIERAKHTAFRKNVGSDVTFFDRVSSVQLVKRFTGTDLHITVAGHAMTLKVLGNKGDQLLQLLNDGVSGKLKADAQGSAPAPAAAPVAPPAPSQGPPAGWYNDPHGEPVQRWWDGSTWTDHTTVASPA